MRTSWRTLALLRNYSWLTFLSFVLAFAHMGLGLAVPKLIQLTIDRAIIGHDTGLLAYYGLTLLAVALVRFAAATGRRLASGRVSLEIEYDLRNRLWAHLLAQSFSYLDRWPTGQLMSRVLSDVQNVRMFLGYGLTFFITNLVSMMAISIVLVVTDWRLALLSLSFLPFLLVVTVRFGRRLQPVLRDVQQRLADVTAAAEENIVGSRVVRIFAREDDEFTKFANRSGGVFAASVAAARIRAIYIPLTAFAPNVAVAILLYVGGRQVIYGDLSLGALVAFYSYLMMLVYPAQMIGWLTSLAQRAVASAERVFELLDARSGLPMSRDTRPLRFKHPGGEIDFDDVSFDFDSRPVLKHIDLKIPAGHTVALVGHTGSGKTTLASFIPRFYDPAQGRVLIDGQNVRDLDLADLRGHIGIVTQDPFLFSTSLAENIRWGRPLASDEDVRAAARVAQADDFIAALPDGFDTIVGERGVTLSGGQRQRVALARALIMDPHILILDDATSSVDVVTESRIQKALREITRGRTTLIVAHRASTLSLADEIVVLERGRVAERGTHEALLARGALYARMFGEAVRERRDLDSTGEEAD